MAAYDLGDLVKVTAAFTDPENSDNPIDPDVVKVSVRTPAAVLTTYTYGTDAEVKKDSTGNYHLLIDGNEAGTWFYRWFSTGNGQAAEEKSFDIERAIAA